MEDYIQRLVLCGWREDQAWALVNNMLRELDWDWLEEFVRREECCACG